MYIYKITNLINNKCYVGQTTNINPKKYIEGHFKNAFKNKDNRHFYNAIRKYNQKNFKWEILGVCYSKKELDEAEIDCIDFFKSNNSLYGYNITAGGGGVLGLKHTDESNQKNREKHLGKKDSEETKERKRLANLRKKLSEQHKEKIKKSTEGKHFGMTGKKHTQESINKMKNKKKGIIFTEEHKLKLSTSHKGQKSTKKGKTYKEIYGEEKAKDIINRVQLSKKKNRENKKENL